MDTQIQHIDRAALSPIVRRALDSDTTEVVDWQCRPLDYIRVWQTSGGIYRFSGTALDRGQVRTWSAILKVALAPTPSPLAAGFSGDLAPASPTYWKREVELFRDGLLDWQDGSFVPPKCYGVVEPDESTGWIWLEEVVDCFGGSWPLEHYAVAARHLGQFNGRYLVGEPIPEHPSFCREWTRARVAGSRTRGASRPTRENWEDPAVRPWIPDNDPDHLAKLWPDRFDRLWDEADDWIDVLDRLPETFCHHDVFRNNLFARPNRGGEPQTVAIDWVQASPGHLGADLYRFVSLASLFMLVDCSTRELDALAFEGYLAGLRDAGWAGDPRLARLGYAAQAAIHAGTEDPTEAVRTPGFITLWSRMSGKSPEEIMARGVERFSYQLDLADEARELLSRVS